MHRVSVVVTAGALGLAAMTAGASAGLVGPIAHETTVEFDYRGSPQRYRIPTGVTEVAVTLCGAEGGEGVDAGEIGLAVEFAPGGLGAEVRSTIVTTPAEVVTLRVGGRGGERGGFNGGGTSQFDPHFLLEGQGGGGATDVRASGEGLDDRVMIAGGGGGGGGGVTGFIPAPINYIGGDGGSVGGDAFDASGGRGGTLSAGGLAGVGAFAPGSDGVLGLGGAAPPGAGGGGGGLYGGGGGSIPLGYGGGGGGGSSLGDVIVDGVCSDDGSASLSFTQPLSVLPFGALAHEGDKGSQVVQVPVFLSAAVGETVTANWATDPAPSGEGVAQPGEDFVAASGAVHFPPGETVTHIPIEVLGDTADEAPLLWGEWGVIHVFDVSANAVLETGPLGGAGVFVIVDND